jgi:hypothetical protein
MTIPAELIDVDFPTRPEFTFGDLGKRAFEPRFESYADVVPVIPESQWPSEAEKIKAAGGGCSALVTRIYDQKNEGSCVANACSQAHEILQAAQNGKANVVHLSAISLYKRIGRSPNSGAMVSDGLDEMAERGVLPLDNPENRAKFGECVMPNTGFRTSYPAGWEAVAKKFAAHEWLIVNTVAELITALIHQHPVVVGRSGHSICYCDPVYDGGSLLVKYANSWSENFGENGFGYDSLRLIRSSASWAFALRSVTTA